jgi:hypothetical protein
MTKKYRKLTKEQKERGVIFSSQLQPNGTIHEVTKENLYQCSEGTDKITLLLDDKFFNNSPYKFNEIRR